MDNQNISDTSGFVKVRADRGPGGEILAYINISQIEVVNIWKELWSTADN